VAEIFAERLGWDAERREAAVREFQAAGHFDFDETAQTSSTGRVTS
jgi:hypothetical protein